MSSSNSVSPFPPPTVVEVLTHRSNANPTLPGKVRTGKRHFDATPCEGPDCNNVVPAGYYASSRRRSFCSITCGNRYHYFKHAIGKCLHCGNPIMGRRPEAGKKLFCSLPHRWAYKTEEVLAPTGPFRPLIEEYFTIAAPNYYELSTTYTVRVSLAKFFRFVVGEEGISTLAEIRPSAITRFIAAERVRGLTSRNFVGHLATFFNWLIAEERYDRANPVVARIHSQRGAPAAPRPYHDRDLEMIWKLVEASGRPELILAFAIGEECGLRIGEVCNIRLSDIDQASQTIFVRLPTKNKKVRTVPYHDKVKASLKLWVAERDPTCRYDNLLHNNARAPFQTGLLDYWFKKLLKHEDEPARSFHFHRLRHTWATRLMNNGMELAVLKVLGGWECWNSMQRYIKVLDSTVRRQYEESYQRLQENDQPEPEEAFSLDDFVSLTADSRTPPPRS